MWKRIVALWMIALICTGCGRHRNPAEESWPVVAMIAVAPIPEDDQPHRVYTEQSKMRQILNSLRTLGQKTTPEVDPESLPLQGHTITLFHTDGTQQVYRTKGGCYIQLSPNPWQQADPKKITELDALLETLPHDGQMVDAASFSCTQPLQSTLLRVYNQKKRKVATAWYYYGFC